MPETMCDSGTVKLKAGNNATALTPSQYTTLINQAESVINVHTHKNYTDTYSSKNADVKKILEDVASSLAAIPVIAYDLAVFANLSEGVARINIQRDIAERGLKLLKEKVNTDFIDDST